MKIQTVGEIVHEKGINALIYGPDHSGKTYSISTLPNLEKTLVLSVETSGLISLKKKCPELKAVKVESMSELFNAYKEIENDPLKYENIVLDSLTEIADLCVSEELEKTNAAGNKVHGQQAYGEMANKIIKMVRAFQSLPINILFICQQGRIQDSEGRLYYGPLLPGKQGNIKLPYLVPFIAALKIRTNEKGSVERAFQFVPSEDLIAGQRGDANLTFEKPNWTTIFNKIKGE